MTVAESRIVVVLPAYRVADTIGSVLARIPACATHIIVVDDGSPDDLASAVARAGDRRIEYIRHPENRGVGAATKTGFVRGVALGADIIVKLDADGQMDANELPKFITPLLAGGADLVKGNRFDDLRYMRRMPAIRRFGNLALSFLVKLASGYWRSFDPCNGYVAMRGKLFGSLDKDRLDDGYFFEISLLCEAWFARARLVEVPMIPVYGSEPSSLNPARALPEFAVRLIQRSVRRVLTAYFVRDFGVISLFLLAGLPLLTFGTVWSAYHWLQSARTGVFASTGTVMIGVLGIVLGFQLLLQAVVLDVDNEPGRRH